MDDLVATGTMDRGVREFLRAVVRAPMNVVIVGGMDSGKSTLERAMIGDADPDERILTIENEVGGAVDFIVHLRHDVCHDPAAPVNRRYVSEIYEVLPPADSIEPAVNRVYVPGPDGRAVPNTVPHRMPKLVEAGFDPALFTARGGGLWS